MDRGELGIKHSVAVNARGILPRVVIAPTNRHDSPLLAETPDARPAAGGADIRLDRGYDSEATRQILQKGKPALVVATDRWIVGRTNPGTAPAKTRTRYRWNGRPLRRP